METAFIQLLATKSNVLIAGDDDQALYGFKGADPRFIRDLATGGDYQRFELPYCSRCTDVIVKSVHDVLHHARRNGNLAGRLEKQFECFMPDKARDSEAHPLIIHAECSVQSKKAPYVGRYIVEQIQRIPDEDIAESAAKGYPTVMVIGPRPFLDAAFDTIRGTFSKAAFRTSQQIEVELLDGYRMIASDERSRLGWRIVVDFDPFAEWADVIAEVTRDEAELVELLPVDYRDHHLRGADLVRRLLKGEELQDAERADLEQRVQLTFEQIAATLAIAEKRDRDEQDDLDDERLEGSESDEPTIVCTSLTGSKGLSAAHVFIVGFNNGHFPRNPNAVTDQEVCQLLVGLSRTRKQCHLVSAGRYGSGWLKPSKFIAWISESLHPVAVDKTYFET